MGQRRIYSTKTTLLCSTDYILQGTTRRPRSIVVMSSCAAPAIALLFVTAILSSRCDPQSAESAHYSKKQLLVHAEKLGERFYQNQLKERERSLNYNTFIHLNPNYPCVHGVVPLGEDTPSSARDGHKFSCGIMHIKSDPIVYSFGSNQQQDFEMAVLHQRPDARIWTHDLLESNLPPLDKRLSTINYTATALGPSSQNKGDTKFKLLHEFMKERGHTYIDLLKIDIEYGEFTWIANEPLDTFTRFGQLMIEVHRPRGADEYVKIKTFVEALEARKLRIFHRELNFIMEDPCCMEFSFITLDWTNWNSVTKFALPPIP